MEFLILPDCPEAEPIARTVAAPGVRTVTHASGRPWAIGRWEDTECVLAEGARNRLLLLGPTRTDPGAAGRLLASAHSPHDLDPLSRALPGSCHLAASFDGRTRTQGSLSTARHVFHARIGGVTVAADSPSGLTALMDTHLDEDTLALQLLLPVPWPLAARTMWTGVRSLGLGCWLDIRPDGEAREVSWWTPPDPDVPIADAADTLREALVDSVAARAAGQDVIGADLSGGLDSTSLCFLAEATDARLLTHHWEPRDRANADAKWAGRAAELMPSARHRFVDVEAGPLWYEAAPDLDGASDDVEGPLVWTRNRAHTESLARTVRADGVTRHLIGVGGDELFGISPQFGWSLIRSDPLRGIRTVRRFRSLNRWPLGATLRSLADRGTFAATLDRAADDLDAPPPPRFTPPTGWGRGDPRMPDWATPDAVATVRRLLRETAARRPEPLHPDRLQHQTLEVTVLSGHAARQLNRSLRPLDVTFETPFLDDRVLEAALSLRVADRVVPGRYKPALTAALRPLVPDAVLDRRDKGAFGQEVYEGLHRNRERIAGLCDDLRLAARGLVDPDALRAALYRPTPDTRALGPFENTLACETWLRSPSAAAPLAATPTQGRR
ncbi:asparagine synthase-related protein [Streptomyces pseudovenezuelae]|uniref:asparagine synthase-related protein n=1 Tax=Streptomyces pseudovenezuelae TaxID=67350 RepID=UPI002E33EC0C|nr:asparagine synthase-related protein [Streptomyces pseudovenezuelae]